MLFSLRFQHDRIMYLCRTFKICVPIYAFISGYGLYLSYRKNNSTPVQVDSQKTDKNNGRVLDHMGAFCCELTAL